jgi:hypothetical protein
LTPGHGWGLFGLIGLQGETVYKEASKEVAELGQDATKGLTDLRASLINRTRAISLSTGQQPPAAAGEASGTDKEATPTDATKGMTSDEALQESETVLSRLRLEAAKRLKDLQKAEDAADEALLRFGGNLRNFLKDAISIAPPSSDNQEARGEVLFESKDAQGKRVIHTSRFDAQLHVIHTTTENFVKDPTGAEYETWSKGFDIEKKTDEIAGDLAKYPELRTTMEKLVPDQIPYADFWKRYYFLRHGIETAEARRRDLLKGMHTLTSINHYVAMLTSQQPLLPRRRLVGTRTPKMKLPGPSRTSLHDQLRPDPLPPSTPGPVPNYSSLPSPASQTTRNRRPIAT